MASLDPQYPGGQSNIKGSRGVPIKRQGLGLRDAMRGADVPLRDRIKARNIDQRAARTGWQESPSNRPEGAGGGGTAPASGNLLNQRQNLFKSMEKAGFNGITPEMREQARRLGVADQDFNAAAQRIQTNETYTPSGWRKSPVAPATTQGTGASASPSAPSPSAPVIVPGPTMKVGQGTPIAPQGTTPAAPAPAPVSPSPSVPVVSSASAKPVARVGRPDWRRRMA